MIVPDNLRYTPEHEWVSLDGDTVTVGITDHAQEELSDVVFVELPDIGKTFSKGDPAAVVESVKAASDIYAPLAGEITEVNNDLTADPSQINQDAYGKGWIYKLRLADPAAFESLMDAGGYTSQVG